MNTYLFPSNTSGAGGQLRDAALRSMLDGYLAATASGPNFLMPDRVLMHLADGGCDITPRLSEWIVRRYVRVNSALNDQAYVPEFDSVQEWCRGYLAGFGDDMLAWAPLLAERPELLASVRACADRLSNAADIESLAGTARSVHAFWGSWRLNSVGSTGLASHLDGLLPSVPAPRGYCH